ncbi:follistatin isoform X1 [Phocoena sinus]|uniref:follistatin isoform X1 n=2 Tax=Phocoena sinus TaxID=42100 RepID=UPI0013C45816|nr:follistatin isoform X1 [Phocoena sinus]
MQAARVVSGSLVTDIDMAGALWLLALAFPPPRPPPTSSIWLFPPLSPPLHSLRFVSCFSAFLSRLSSSTLTPSPSPPGLLPLPARRLSPPTPPLLTRPPPRPCLPAAGNCWLRQAKNGRCQVLYKTELTKEECCSTGRLSTSWTEEDVNDNTLFKWMIFNGGAPNCIPCKETCENVDCGPGKKCRMNKKNKPRCVCAPDCSNITWKGPVCGLDGKTYRNECALLKARCKEQPELEVQYQGKCKKTCRDVFCPGSSTCVVDQTNNAYCVTCNRICPEPTSSEQYLCGNDGVTYSSACHLRKATCLLGRSIGLAYEGKCIKAKSCEDIQCTGGKKCLWDFKVGRGRCSLCDELCPESKSEEPVCASDNATYASECAMKEAACSSGVLLEVKHSGSCNSISEDTEEEEEDEDQDYSFPISSILEW